MASAAMVAILSLAAIAVMSPGPYYEAGRASLEHAALEGVDSDLVGARGVPWLATAPAAEVCSAAAAWSNDTVQVSAAVGTIQCDPAPAPGDLVARLVVPSEGRSLVLEAWARAGG